MGEGEESGEDASGRVVGRGEILWKSFSDW